MGGYENAVQIEFSSSCDFSDQRSRGDREGGVVYVLLSPDLGLYYSDAL